MIKKGLYRDFLAIGNELFPRNTVVALVYQVIINLESPRTYVINCHSEQVDFVECGGNV